MRAFAKEHQVLIRYERLRQQIRDNAEERKEKIHWFFSLKSGVSLRDHLARYIELEKVLHPLEDIKLTREKAKKKQNEISTK